MTKLAVMEATAKAMPCAPSIMVVLTPITSRTEETRITTGSARHHEMIKVTMESAGISVILQAISAERYADTRCTDLTAMWLDSSWW